MGGIHTASNICNEADSACLPPVWLKSERLQRLRVLIRRVCASGAALALPDITLCKFWEWLAVMFRIQRSSLFMLKPLMRSHCKAMCHRKLANCFGRVTAIVDIHVWEWLPVIFRIRRSSSIMLKPMRSHCKAMCYTKLANCFGRVTVVGDIHVSITRNVADPQSCGNH